MSSTLPSQTSSLYTDLQMRGRQIRLIEIISTKPEIVCKLTVVSLEDEPAYSALSYVWGNPKATQSVLVNGRPINVTKNLASALEHAPQHLENANVAPRLWADALCIDQNDPNEKNHQVPLMKDIYSQAEIVICWMGQPNDAIHRAMDWIDVIARECSFKYDDEEQLAVFDHPSGQSRSDKADVAETLGQTSSGDIGDASTTPDEAATMDSFNASSGQLKAYQARLRELGQNLAKISERQNLQWLDKHPSFYEEIRDDKGGLKDLKDMFDLPYWRRVWVFQEMALPKKPIFACGIRSISLASLDQLARWTQWLMEDTSINKPDYGGGTMGDNEIRLPLRLREARV
ncbi:hypothetical protein ACHAPT_008632 [Fusarium lateritium]